jgi:hypothetical protein
MAFRAMSIAAASWVSRTIFSGLARPERAVFAPPAVLAAPGGDGTGLRDGFGGDGTGGIGADRGGLRFGRTRIGGGRLGGDVSLRFVGGCVCLGRGALPGQPITEQ